MAQSLASTSYVGEAGGLREWDSPVYGGEIPPLEIWSWRPVAPVKPEPPVQTSPVAATQVAQVAQVLAAWRAAERRLQDLLEASPMRTLVRSEIAQLRAEYQRLFVRAMR